MDANKQTAKKKVPIAGIIALILTMVILSGLMADAAGPLKALDFTNLLGSFGKLGTVAEDGAVTLAKDFRGTGGAGPKDAYMGVFQIAPGIIVAFGIIELYNTYGGAAAAEFLFGKIIRRLMGVPGGAVPAFVANLTSSDASAGILRTLVDAKAITREELIVSTSFCFSAASPLVNFYMMLALVFPYLEIPLFVPLLVIIIMKFVGALILRAYFALTKKKEAA